MPPMDQIDTAERLVRVETKLDFIIKSLEDLAPKHANMEDRIAKLEKFVNRAVGALIAIDILMTLFAFKLKDLL